MSLFSRSSSQSLFRRPDARLATFPANDPHYHGVLLATQGLVCTRDGRIYCASCHQYYGLWDDSDRALNPGHRPRCTAPGPAARPAANHPDRQDPRRDGFPGDALGPNVRFRVRGVQDSGQGVALLCVG